MVRTDGTLLPIIKLPLESPLLNIEDDCRRAYSDLHVCSDMLQSPHGEVLVMKHF